MKIHYETADARLFVELAGELDHHSMDLCGRKWTKRSSSTIPTN